MAALTFFGTIPGVSRNAERPGAVSYTHLDVYKRQGHYGGSNVGNSGALDACEGEWMNRPANLQITIPPLAAVLLRCG